MRKPKNGMARKQVPADQEVEEDAREVILPEVHGAVVKTTENPLREVVKNRIKKCI